MASVRSFDPISGVFISALVTAAQSALILRHAPGVLVADAGCILENLTNYLAPHNHIMPLDLGAKGRLVVHSYQ